MALVDDSAAGPTGHWRVNRCGRHSARNAWRPRTRMEAEPCRARAATAASLRGDESVPWTARALPSAAGGVRSTPWAGAGTHGIDDDEWRGDRGRAEPGEQPERLRARQRRRHESRRRSEFASRSSSRARSRPSPWESRSSTAPRSPRPTGLIFQQDRHDRLHPVVHQRGHLEQPQRVPGRRGVDHDQIASRAGVHAERFGDVDDGGKLVDARRRQFEEIPHRLLIDRALPGSDESSSIPPRGDHEAPQTPAGRRAREPAGLAVLPDAARIVGYGRFEHVADRVGRIDRQQQHAQVRRRRARRSPQPRRRSSCRRRPCRRRAGARFRAGRSRRRQPPCARCQRRREARAPFDRRPGPLRASSTTPPSARSGIPARLLSRPRAPSNERERRPRATRRSSREERLAFETPPSVAPPARRSRRRASSG